MSYLKYVQGTTGIPHRHHHFALGCDGRRGLFGALIGDDVRGMFENQELDLLPACLTPSLPPSLPHSLPHSLTHPLMVCATPCIQNGWTLLMRASRGGHLDCAELLLSRKADPNLQNKVTRGEGWEVSP